MAHKWTHEERKRHLRTFYHTGRSKAIVTVCLVLIILLLLAALGYSIRTNYDPGLTLILSIVLAVLVFVSVFIMDTYFYETW